MKNNIPSKNAVVFLAVAVLWSGSATARADDEPQNKAIVLTTAPTIEVSVATNLSGNSAAASATASITIDSVEPSDKKDKAKSVTWLGLGVEESTEALSSQLGLKTGEGLTVTMVAADSPAAKAEFHTNDVLVELDGQMLVHPLQLRKLVQMHAEGDPISLTFYRGGKKQTMALKLGKTTWSEPSEPEDPLATVGRQNFQWKFGNLDGQMAGLGQALARAGIDKSKMNTEIKRTMEQTRKAIQDALQRATTDQKSLAGVDKELEALTRDGVDVDKDATVIIRNKHNSNKTMVETDDSGSYIIEQGAKTHLTARGKDGKLLFEGEIDTAAEREKVPKEVWEKVAPMFEQMTAPEGLKPKAEQKLDERDELLKQKA